MKTYDGSSEITLFKMPTTMRELAKHIAQYSGSRRSIGTIANSVLSAIGLLEDLEEFRLNNVPSDKVNYIVETVRKFYETFGYYVQPEFAGKDNIIEYLFKTPFGDRARVSFFKKPVKNQKINLEVSVMDPSCY